VRVSVVVVTARTDFNANQAARASAKATTQTWYNSCSDMRDPGRGYIATIKGYAESTNNPDVFAIGMVDPPAPPSPAPPPEVPVNVSGTVSPTGDVTLTWDATPAGASSGIFFLVERKRQGETVYSVIGGTQEKTFFDPEPHVTAGPVSYQIRAQRGTDQSAWTTPIVFNLAA